jgi:hypothetical protein
MKGAGGWRGEVEGCGWASSAVGLLRLGAAAGWGGLCWRAGVRAWCVGSCVGLGLAGVPPSLGCGVLSHLVQ